MNYRNYFQRLVALVCLFAVEALARGATDFSTDVFVSGEGGYHTYRIPALIRAANGDLLAFCEGRKDSREDNGDIDVLCKRSTDAGKTWSEAAVVWDDKDNSCSSPCPVVDTATGTIWLLLTHNLGTDNESEIVARRSRGSPTVWLTHSEDHGRTWAPPREITAAAKDPAWTWYATGPGIGIQIRNGAHAGRLVIPCDHKRDGPTGAVEESHVIFSDDHGKTWQRGGSTGPRMNESQVAERFDGQGTLLLSMRPTGGPRLRGQAVSTDGGVSWTAPSVAADLPDTRCQGSVLRHEFSPTTGVLLFSNPANAKDRVDLTVRVSRDGGQTWRDDLRLFSGPAAYSSLVSLSPTEVACLYECGDTLPYRRLRFTRFSVAPGETDALAARFRSPPPAARPQIWWHWRDGDITREGITGDLESMQRVGLGGAHIFNLGPEDTSALEDRVKVLSPEWRTLTRFAVEEAARLGLEITLQNCPGWDQSGGPWVTPELAMKQLEWTTTVVQGGKPFSGPLPQPRAIGGYYRDVAVLAFPASADERQSLADLAPVVTTSAPGVDGMRVLQGPDSEGIELPFPSVGRPQYVQFDFHAPKRWGSVRIRGHDEQSMPDWGNVEVSDDGVTFRKVGVFPSLSRARKHELMTVVFPETTARFFRVVIQKIDEEAPVIKIRAIEFGGARLDRSEELAGYRASDSLKFIDTPLPAECAPGQVIDLSAQMRDGKLEWNAPPGDWTVVRLGATLTGKMVGPAPKSGQGLEVDKLSRDAVTAHFEAMAGKVIADAGPLAGKTLRAVLADSWEAGCANWTPRMREEFRRRRGYELLPWLPALAGRIIGSAEETQRFLWDYRRTLADLLAENYYGTLRELCHQHGMIFTAEAPGDGLPTIAEGIEVRGVPDIPMGEFWMVDRKPFDPKETASAAHTHGAPLAAAEAFSSNGDTGNWRKGPADFKPVGDLAFTRGINRFVLHRFAFQPRSGMGPGYASSHWGTNFDRTNTWWEQSRTWIQYLTRCQELLQSGRFVADILYFNGEAVPNRLGKNVPAFPAGYDFDGCDRDVLLHRLTVKDGRLVLPDGMSYRVLVLPEADRMTPEVLRRIRGLVQAGATVIGARPSRSPSLVGYPQSDAEIAVLAGEIWADCNGRKVTEHRLGLGRVIQGPALAEVLTKLDVSPDFKAEGEGRYAFIHRQIDGAEVYFVSSQSATAVDSRLSFRVSGRQPELWNPATDEITRPALYQDAAGRTTLAVKFDPFGSMFVVFRTARGATQPVASIERDGRDVTAAPDRPDVTFGDDGRIRLATDRAGSYALHLAEGGVRLAQVAGAAVRTIDGPWEVRFPPGWDAPERVKWKALHSWTEDTDEGVKYFSGTATYVTEFDLPADWLQSAGGVTLDLGGVEALAEVTLNGHDLGVWWRPPFAAEVAPALRPGRNQLTVRVTNLWPNRMIGDQRLSVGLRHTWATFNPYTADSPLLSSGLLGPVTLRPRAVVQLQP